MNLTKYQRESQRSALNAQETAATWCDHLRNDAKFKLLHGAMGVCTEAGELQDILKKHLMYGKELDLTHIKEEVGDMLWYLAEIATACEFDLAEAAQDNINKLKLRYPVKFTQEDALARKDKECPSCSGTGDSDIGSMCQRCFGTGKLK